MRELLEKALELLIDFAYYVPFTKTQEERQLNAKALCVDIKAKLADGNTEESEELKRRLKIARDAATYAAWKDMLNSFSDQQRQHIANLLAHQWIIGLVELRSPTGDINRVDAVNAGITQSDPFCWAVLTKEGRLQTAQRYKNMCDEIATENESVVPLYKNPTGTFSGSCSECGKKASDGWALYCVSCAESALDRPLKRLDDKESIAIANQFGGMSEREWDIVAAFEKAYGINKYES